MNLNDKQREVLQALLDGKNVRYKYKHTIGDSFDPVTINAMQYLMDGLEDDAPISDIVEFKIQPEPVKVALFQKENLIQPFSFIDYRGPGWKQVSEWVEIQPIE